MHEERSHGHITNKSLVKDFYIKFLERSAAKCQAMLISEVHPKVKMELGDKKQKLL